MKTIDRLARKGESRSAIVERLVRESLAARAKQAAADRDRALLDAHADALNAEIEDVLRYQSEL